MGKVMEFEDLKGERSLSNCPFVSWAFVDICCFNRMTMKTSIMYSTHMLTGKTIW